MDSFAVGVTDTNTDATTIGYIAQPASPNRRARFFGLNIGSKAAPQDYQGGYQLQYFTAENGTPGGTAKTPTNYDTVGGAAASLTAREAPTGEPTYTAGAVFLQLGINFRTAFSWYAYNIERGFIIANNANDGLGLKGFSPSTAFEATATFHWEE